jgi:pyruvate/2-oxoglutarate dehydrogenase complex dihydrolipoamide acyltransferase (E2) component
MSVTHEIKSPFDGILLKWLTSNNQKVQSEQNVAQISLSESNELFILKSTNAGVLKRILNEGENVKSDDVIGEVVECNHPAVFRNLCVSCGKKILPSESSNKQPSHGTKLTMAGGQTIQLSKSEAKLTQQTKMLSLKKSRKLALILDLDSTLVHATAFHPFPQEILDQVKTIQLEDNGFILRYPSPPPLLSSSHGLQTSRQAPTSH